MLDKNKLYRKWKMNNQMSFEEMKELRNQVNSDPLGFNEKDKFEIRREYATLVFNKK